MALESGSMLAHYEIKDLLGKGGMGEVYRARDTKLKRDVAIKTLPPNMATDPERLARFRREAETVAGLNHPNIFTLFSVEEDSGVNYLTMELIPGRSLDRVITGGGLSLHRIIEIGCAVADALTAAHHKGIVHRDLKPANVMVSDDGVVKVLDFGLAKLIRSDDVALDDDTQNQPLTQEGSLLGTLPYMSPEQLRVQPLDHRSDLFSFGILLYELATGRRPFRGDSHVDVTMAILQETPVSVGALKPDLPPHLGRIISRCLEKNPEDRYQTAADIRNHLRGLRQDTDHDLSHAHTTLSFQPPAGNNRRKRLTIALAAAVLVIALLAFLVGRGGESPEQSVASTSTEAEDTSIAVLAFINMSDDAGNEYFSDGISEELLTLLAKIPELRVISRGSAFSFKGKDLEIPEIAKRLNVAHILDGSVRKAENRVRITVQLIEARTDSNLWSETYDRALDDVFAIQDEIAATVVEQLKVELLGEVPKVAATDPEAYALYLQAQYLGRQITAESMEESIALYERALAIDPESAAAWDGLAANYLIQTNNGLRSTDEGYLLAQEAAEKAVSLDPGFAPAHETLSWIAMWRDNDLAAAAGHIEQALALDPRGLNIIRSAATVLEHLGRLDESIALGEYVTSRDPVNANGHTNLGNSYLYAGRWGDAIASYLTSIRLNPVDIGGHYNVGLALLFNGEPQPALEAFARESDEEWRIKGRALALYALDRRAEHETMLTELIEGWGDEWPSEIAHVYAFAGDTDSALTWLDKAITKNEPGLTEQFLLPFFSSIHGDPRWMGFLERVGSSPEQLDTVVFKGDVLPR